MTAELYFAIDLLNKLQQTAVALLRDIATSAWSPVPHQVREPMNEFMNPARDQWHGPPISFR